MIDDEIAFDKRVIKMIGNIMNKTLKKVTELALDCLQQHIADDVYMYDYFPNYKYTNSLKLFDANKIPKNIHNSGKGGERYPTFGFYNAFKLDNVKGSIEHKVRNILYDIKNMPFSPEDEVHYDEVEGDIREELFDALNVRGVYASKERNAYWDEFLKELDSKLKQWIEQTLKDMGVEASVT